MWYLRVQGIPSELGPEMELFRMPFERHYSDLAIMFK